MTDGGNNRRHILVIDNDSSVRSTFRKLLDQAGYKVATAANTEEAFSRLGQSVYDLIYLATELGATSGIQLLEEIRKMKLPASILVMTREPDATSAKKAFELGASGHITKPVSPAKLLRLTKLALRP